MDFIWTLTLKKLKKKPFDFMRQSELGTITGYLIVIIFSQFRYDNGIVIMFKVKKFPSFINTETFSTEMTSK